MATRLPLGGLQIDAFTIFVEESDACYAPGEAPEDDPPFPGRRAGATLTIDPGAERAAWDRLIDVTNELDGMGWAEHRDAMSRLASRVGRLAFAKG